MSWAWVIFALVAAFAMLATMGNERQRLLDELPPPADSPSAEGQPTTTDSSSNAVSSIT